MRSRNSSNAGRPGSAAVGSPSVVALEVRRGLVTVEGARRYGVVLDGSGAVDAAATEGLRDGMRAGRPDPLPTFDMGPPVEELLARCEEETGLPAPTRPTWAARPTAAASTAPAAAAASPAPAPTTAAAVSPA